MSGIAENNFPAFARAAILLRAQEFDVVSPHEIAQQFPDDWAACLRADIRALCECDAIVMMPGWMDSSGAHLEMHIAHRLKLQIYDGRDWGI